jgi:oligopeptide transport system substrate-binding protein
MKFRPLFSTLLCALAAGLLLSSPSAVHAATAVETGNRDQILHLGNLSEPTDLDPQIITVQTDFNIVQALFEGLVQYDPKTCEPLPAGATTWEVSADNLTWTFHLRPGAKWSNGDPVTAHDYVYAYRRILSPALAAEYASMLFALKNGEAYNAGKITDATQIGARAADTTTLVLTLDHPVPYLPTMLCHCSWFPVHRATIEKFGKMDQRGTAWTRPGNLIGNGYFTLTDWKPHQYIRVSKSPTYWDRDQIKLKEVFFYPIESDSSEEAAFRAGQLHVTLTLPITKIAVYEKEKSPAFRPSVFLATYVYRFNTTKPPLNDPRVRRALAMALDRDQIVKYVSKGHQVPASNFCPPNVAGFTAKARVPQDIAAAKKLLAEAGFPDGKGFPRLDILFNTLEGHRVIAEAVQQMWRKNLGIDIGLYNQEGKVWSASMRSLDYQIARFAWIGDFLDPSTFLDIMASDSGNNQTGWKNAEYDRLIAAAKTTADKTKRYEYYQRCEEILAEECPMAPVYFYSRNNLVRPEVKGWYSNLLDTHPLKGVHLDASAAK